MSSSSNSTSSDDSPIPDDVMIAVICVAWAITVLSIYFIYRIKKFITESKSVSAYSPPPPSLPLASPSVNQHGADAAPSESPSDAVTPITINDENSARNWIITSKEIDVHEVIGNGTLGRVYSGKWRGLQVAIKEMTSTAKEEQLSYDMNLLIKVRHPNLVLFMGIAQPSSSKFWIISEYLSRGNLYSVLHDSTVRVDWKRKLSMILDIARALNYLHCCKPSILHKSLNSLNILIDKDLIAKVSDYGLDIVKSSAKSSSSLITQPLWSAPEVLKKNKYSKSSDVYSFGIILWEIITRKTPYMGKIRQMNNVKTVQSICDGMRPDFPPKCPPALHSLITSCWHSDPAKRPEFSEIVIRLNELEKEKFPNDLFEMKEKDEGLEPNGNAKAVVADKEENKGSSSAISALEAILATSERRPWMIDIDELKFSTLIGKGSFGEVYEGEFRGKKVAIKKLNMNMKGSANNKKQREELIMNFIRELNIMCSLRHPNVVLFIGACLHPDTPCIVMEYCDKGNLYSILHDKSQHIDYNLILKILIQSAEGILYLHLNQPPILHRDLKSLNLLVDSDFNIKVSDFGLTELRESGADGGGNEKDAKKEEKGNNGELQLGTSLWLAPEAMESASAFTEKSDVYSFGIIIWELFTREIPFKELNPYQAALAVLTEDRRPTIPAFVPPKFADLVESCWNKDSSKRPTFQSIIHSLKELKREGLPRVDLSLANSKLYRKKMEVFAFKSKDAVIVYKSWGTGEGKKGDWVIVGPGQDIYTCDAQIFAKTYARVSEEKPHLYRKTEAIYAVEMKNDFLMETLEGMEHGAAGDFIAQNPVDGEQWPIARNTFLMMYEELSEQKLSQSQLNRLREKELMKEKAESNHNGAILEKEEEDEKKATTTPTPPAAAKPTLAVAAAPSPVLTSAPTSVAPVAKVPTLGAPRKSMERKEEAKDEKKATKESPELKKTGTVTRDELSKPKEKAKVTSAGNGTSVKTASTTGNNQKKSVS